MKETKELLVGFLVIARLMAETFKDGVQTQDLADILKKLQEHPELAEKLKEAYNGVENVSEELKHFGMAEFVQLIGAALPEIVQLTKTLAK